MFTLNLMAMIAENKSQKISERVQNSASNSTRRGIVRILFLATTEQTNTLLLLIEKAVGYRKLRLIHKKNGYGEKCKILLVTRQDKKLKDGQP